MTNKPETFADVMQRLEECLAELEKGDLSGDKLDAKMQEAANLREKGRRLLEEERKAILKACSANGIDPSEIGINLSDDDDDDDDDEDEDEDDN